MNMCGLILPCQNHTTKKAKSITLFQTTVTAPFRAAHTHIPYSLYIGVPPPPIHTPRPLYYYRQQTCSQLWAQNTPGLNITFFYVAL